MTSILNLRDFPRGIRLPYDVRRIDRRTKYGNPYVISKAVRDGHQMTRTHVIDLYRIWLADRLLVEPSFLEPLRGYRLACYCRPIEGFAGRLMCHGQIIVGILAGVEPSSVE